MYFTILLTIALALGTETSHSQSVNFASLPSIEHKSLNEACKINVSDAAGAIPTVILALDEECAAPEGYEITLLDFEHHEYLQIDQNSTILIKGGNGSATLWTIMSEEKQIILVLQGIVTLENIEFQFNIINDDEPIITPSHSIIYAENDKLLPSLTLKQCIFQSVSGVYDSDIYQVFICDATKAEFIECSFKGLGIDKVSNVSMIHIEFCKQITLKKCKFQDAQIYNEQFGPISLEANIQDGSFAIQDCSFTNIILNGEDSKAVLFVLSTISHKSDISGNTFINCSNINQLSGALYINDNAFDGTDNKYVFSNNTFTNNTGKVSGAIYLDSEVQFLHYNFTNNKFTQNKNNATDGLGQDAYFLFQQPAENWTDVSVTTSLKDIFNGSASDAKNASVYFEAQKGEKVAYSGFLTLSNPVQPAKKWYNNKYFIIGGSVGLGIIIIVIVIIITSCVYSRKRNAKYSSKGQEKDPLIPRPQQRSA